MDSHYNSFAMTVGFISVVALLFGIHQQVQSLPSSDQLAQVLVSSRGVGTTTIPNLITGGLTSDVSTSTGTMVYSFSGHVVNVGTASAGSSETRLRVDFLTGSSTAMSNPLWDVELTASTSPLVPGGSELESWIYATTTSPGTGVFEVCADVADQVLEDRFEKDNCVFQWF